MKISGLMAFRYCDPLFLRASDPLLFFSDADKNEDVRAFAVWTSAMLLLPSPPPIIQRLGWTMGRLRDASRAQPIADFVAEEGAIAWAQNMLLPEHADLPTHKWIPEPEPLKALKKRCFSWVLAKEWSDEVRNSTWDFITSNGPDGAEIWKDLEPFRNFAPMS